MVKALSILLLGLHLGLVSSVSAQGLQDPSGVASQNEYIVVRTSTDQPMAIVAPNGDSIVAERFISGRFAVAVRRPAPVVNAAPTPVAAATVPDDSCFEIVRQGMAISCSPNFIYETTKIPNDPLLLSQWGLYTNAGIRGPSAWDLSTSSQDVAVAIIDTGIDFFHPDINPNMWVNVPESAIPWNGIDDDGNGYIDDIFGANIVGANGFPYDDNYHGTHVAGIVGARGDNKIGISGVAWRASLIAVKALDAAGTGSLESVVRAFDYVVALRNRGEPIRVINTSWGNNSYSPVLDEAIYQAQLAGIVVVAAAGNSGQSTVLEPFYPASLQYPNLVGVSAVDVALARPVFANWGAPTVDVWAPGVDILSTIPGGGYGWSSGTSMSAAFVSGSLAIAFGLRPNVTAETATALVSSTSRDVEALRGLGVGGTLVTSRLVAGFPANLP